MAMNTDATFERRLTVSFKDDMRNLANFHQSTQKWDFHWVILYKVENV